jgi:hypothetical protein
MKRFTILFIFLACAVTALAQQTENPLSKTRWKGMVNVPDPIASIIIFDTATATIKEASSGEFIEEISYTIENNVLTLKKIEGSSPCPTNQIAKITITIVDKQLTLKVISDECPLRGVAFNDEKGTPYVWTKE